MLVNIIIPRVGVDVKEFRLVEWKANEGEHVVKGKKVLLVETEKTQWDIEAEISGYLHILLEEGKKTGVGSIVGLLAETNEEYEKAREYEYSGTSSSESEDNATGEKRSKPEDLRSSGKKSRKNERIMITPVARKMAEKHSIDITRINGSGPGNRIKACDVEEAIKSKDVEDNPNGLYQGKKVTKTETLEGMRETISEHMYRSLSNTAQMTVMGELDMTETIRVREDFLSREKDYSLRISYIDILVFLVAKTLKIHPSINCSLIDKEIMFWDDINVGVAVALGEEGLIVPVIKNADKKSLIDISQEIKDLFQKARERSLMPDEVTGGTFTISTVGKQSESRFQTPILNEPQAALLGTGAISERAVVRSGQITIRPMMPYSFTFDHRIINGFAAEQFMGKIRFFIENPSRIILY